MSPTTSSDTLAQTVWSIVADLGWSRIVLGRREVIDLPFDPHGARAGSNAGQAAAMCAERLGRH